jgi:hypothetical protein
MRGINFGCGGALMCTAIGRSGATAASTKSLHPMYDAKCKTTGSVASLSKHVRWDRRHWGEQPRSGWRPQAMERSQITRYFTPLEHQGAVHAAPTRQQQHRRLCLRMRERLAVGVADGEAGRAAARRRARQQPGGTNSSPESDVQDNAVAEPQSAAQRRRADATRSDSDDREQGAVPVRGRRGLSQRRRRSGGSEQEAVLMRGRKRLRQRRSRGTADHGHRDNAQRPSMVRSAALTTIAVLMASTAAAAEPHGSPGVAGAQAHRHMHV